MKTIGVTGAQGRLGSYLCANFKNYVPLDCDVTDGKKVVDTLQSVRPDVILHLAAKSDVEWCERKENSRILSQVNLRGTFNVCHAAENLGIRVTLLSSDHVFSGSRGSYSEKDKPEPVNQYGLSKMAAEALQAEFENLFVVRTSYLFDKQRLSSQMGKLWLGRPEHYPTDITRSFLYINHMALLLDHYFDNLDRMPKIVHLAGANEVSWYDFMSMLATFGGIQDAVQMVLPTRYIHIEDLAPRPRWGGLNIQLSYKLGFPAYFITDGLKEMFAS